MFDNCYKIYLVLDNINDFNYLQLYAYSTLQRCKACKACQVYNMISSPYEIHLTTLLDKIGTHIVLYSPLDKVLKVVKSDISTDLVKLDNSPNRTNLTNLSSF